MSLTDEQIRKAGGIVHRDGNIFFTNINQLNSAIESAATAPRLKRIAEIERELETERAVSFRDQVAQLERELEAVRKDAGWRAIDTAPKDGTAVLVSEGRFCYCVEWNEEFDWWAVDDNKLGPFRLRGQAPTHWMPLPPPPDAAKENQ